MRALDSAMDSARCAEPQRVIRDPAYASECVVSLLDLADRIETLRGAGRLFIP